MSNAKYKNYLDHEIHVKIVDGILEHSQDWQWFINYVEENFELSDIKTFSEFQSRSIPLTRVLSYFLKIIEICDLDFQFESMLLKDMYFISKYHIGAIERVDCSKRIVTEFSKILFLLVWLTKLQNSGNNLKYIIDNRFLTQRNYHQAINMEDFDYDKEEIILYIEEIKFPDFEEFRHNIEDNLNRVVYEYSIGFFEKYGTNLLSVNCFNYQSFERDSSLTWQENTLLDMLQISIRKGEMSPMYSSGDSVVPNYSSWTSDLLEKLKTYFNHNVSNFVIESVEFLLYKKVPSIHTVETHCKLFLELLNDGEDYEILSSSTYEILSMLNKEGVINGIEKTEVIEDFYKTLHSITSLDLLMKLQYSLPISRHQIRIVKDYIENKYETISTINDIPTLTKYLENTDIARNINQYYYDETKNKFLELIEGIKDISVPNLFYQAMLFLLEVNHTNQNVDKRIIKQDMINIQEYWQYNIYKEQVDSLQEFSNKTEVSRIEVEKYNNSIMINPTFLANNCIISSVQGMITVMKDVSEYPLIYLVNKISLSPIFPVKDTGINFDRHDTDNILKSQVEEIIKKYGYKFLNVLDVDIYVSVLHKRYIQNTIISIAIFNREKELYTLVEKLLGIPLIPYENDISLGHLTQLFPLLEIEIRCLGKMFGIVPFKESLDEFMKFKDPSSILRELLDNIYKELNGFENATDLLFLYHFMYNSNSLNIRNECIHGREYIEGYQLKFGFKITLLALYMVKYRINLILTNIANNDENSS